jgi:hypothetical protein
LAQVWRNFDRGEDVRKIFQSTVADESFDDAAFSNLF